VTRGMPLAVIVLAVLIAIGIVIYLLFGTGHSVPGPY
jgi:hypothetical protein